MRHNVIAQELIRELLSRNARSQTSALSDLATRAGILHSHVTQHVSILVTGAPFAARCTDVATALIDDGWATSIAATQAALPWIAATTSPP